MIDPTDPKKYRLRNGCEVVRITRCRGGAIEVEYVGVAGAKLKARLGRDGTFCGHLGPSIYDLVPATTDEQGEGATIQGATDDHE